MRQVEVAVWCGEGDERRLAMIEEWDEEAGDQLPISPHVQRSTSIPFSFLHSRYDGKEVIDIFGWSSSPLPFTLILLCDSQKGSIQASRVRFRRRSVRFRQQRVRFKRQRVRFYRYASISVWNASLTRLGCVSGVFLRKKRRFAVLGGSATPMRDSCNYGWDEEGLDGRLWTV
ncbi:hypothetical protein Acr_01g0007920 [Actinidia rufa]|uniref:Uncharacterized protein n=1 Tax=Actinidia rufa TaxID=165716 RepID=A0A7J0E383_9ERIC|nr:hypothetical protein Acr_01g0007920 [Actinidia rufa]